MAGIGGAMTVAAYAPRVMTLCPPRSLDTYGTGFRRLVDAFGSRRLTEITVVDLADLRDHTHRDVGLAMTRRAQELGRRLRSYEASAHGYGAAENLVWSCRFFFRCAVDEGFLDSSPATRLKVPRRPPAPERALTSAELVELYEVATTTGDDTELDSLILQFVRQTAARRGGVLSARVGGLDVTRGAVTLTEKGGIAREVPCGRALQSRLENFARARGAQGTSDHVFRYSNGTPLSRRRFNSLFDRIDRHTDWTEQLDVGIHWIRHTTLTDIALVADMRVAAAYAGHSFDDGPVTLRYTKPTFEELIAAHDAVFPEAAIAVSPSDR